MLWRGSIVTPITLFTTYDASFKLLVTVTYFNVFISYYSIVYYYVFICLNCFLLFTLFDSSLCCIGPFHSITIQGVGEFIFFCEKELIPPGKIKTKSNSLLEILLSMKPENNVKILFFFSHFGRTPWKV